MTTEHLTIVGAKWTRDGNLLKCRCSYCGKSHWHSAKRWIVRCPRCGTRDELGRMRLEYARLKRSLASGKRRASRDAGQLSLDL